MMYHDSPLGKNSVYDASYNPDLLFAILRQEKRTAIGITNTLPFVGFDLWHHYEVSWLNEKGKPIVALAEICYSCHTPFMIESKSMKLYFNTFNNTVFKDENIVSETIKKDLENTVDGLVNVKVMLLSEIKTETIFSDFEGECLDNLDIDCTVYTPMPSFLKTGKNIVTEVLHSNLLKSNCLVTQQPDWGSIQISYTGKEIHKPDLLRYLVSFRNHNEFHEQCIERIFVDILHHCQPDSLTVYGRYTRRGGIDINPYRTTLSQEIDILNRRLCRQ